MRIDKFLKVSRILKRRAVANAACDGGRVSVNGRVCKPSYALKEGDIVELSLGSKKLTFKVLSLKEHAKKEEAGSMYEIIGEQ
ncbi:MAG: RNA-binding S4 domain-containing protein [Clostridiales bacterium]|jgi:ribosomal 50S subunit-recycling heat shock protein|nr:RNA-binding S4 domain-containing protein [Clostridiales bacterium]